MKIQMDNGKIVNEMGAQLDVQKVCDKFNELHDVTAELVAALKACADEMDRLERMEGIEQSLRIARADARIALAKAQP